MHLLVELSSLDSVEMSHNCMIFKDYFSSLAMSMWHYYSRSLLALVN